MGMPTGTARILVVVVVRMMMEMRCIVVLLAGGAPPHGPLRRFFGQFMGQDMPVEDSTHWPHMRQSNRMPLISRSVAAVGRSSR
jgi:hypothetical protein